jgi:Ankyrin repeats (many copies)
LRKAGAHFSPDEMDRVISMFIKTVVDGDLDKFMLYIESGIDPNVTFQDSRTALHIAATENRIDFVSYLVDLALADLAPPELARTMSDSSREEQLVCQTVAVNLNPLDRWQKTPLIDAQFCKNYGIVSILEKALNDRGS